MRYPALSPCHPSKEDLLKEEVSYGYRKVSPWKKTRLVVGHFETIADRYDLADALLSFGLHFFWRRVALERLNLKNGDRVLDLCGGTGDFAILASRKVEPAGKVVVCDISRAMIVAGRQKAVHAQLERSIAWVQGDAESMSFPDNSFDAIIVGYGIRNFVFLKRGFQEIHRVLKDGGKFLALEFSIPKTKWIRNIYHLYSFHLLPKAGKIITGTAEPFHYLAESIRVFPAPEDVQNKLAADGFKNTAFERLTNGIAVLYTGEKGSVP